MGVDLLFLKGPLNNVSNFFYDSTFTVLALKIPIITFTTSVGVSWCLSPVNSITNSSILNSQIISKNKCYQILLQIFTEARNRIVPGFGEGMEKGTGTNLPTHF